MGKGSEKSKDSIMSKVEKFPGIRHICAIFYLLWLFLWWYRFDKSVRISVEQKSVDRFYDIWYGEEDRFRDSLPAQSFREKRDNYERQYKEDFLTPEMMKEIKNSPYKTYEKHRKKLVEYIQKLTKEAAIEDFELRKDKREQDKENYKF